MFDAYNKILIKGRKYENETTFVFFRDDKRLAFVFGQNGSGKSTIAAGLYNGEVVNEDLVNLDLSVSLGSDTGANITVRCESSVRPAAIRVFDEAYVDRNVRVMADGIKTIVLVGENGRVFGSISAKEIAQAAKEQLNLELDKKKLVLKDSIKAIGTHSVKVKLHPEVTAELTVKVTEE